MEILRYAAHMAYLEAASYAALDSMVYGRRVEVRPVLMMEDAPDPLHMYWRVWVDNVVPDDEPGESRILWQPPAVWVDQVVIGRSEPTMPASWHSQVEGGVYRCRPFAYRAEHAPNRISSAPTPQLTPAGNCGRLPF